MATYLPRTLSFLHRGAEPRLYFWRASTGDEVDLVIETPAGSLPVEVKATATATPSPAMARGFCDFGNRFETRARMDMSCIRAMSRYRSEAALWRCLSPICSASFKTKDILRISPSPYFIMSCAFTVPRPC